jgi:hypothetical protein
MGLYRRAEEADIAITHWLTDSKPGTSLLDQGASDHLALWKGSPRAQTLELSEV